MKKSIIIGILVFILIMVGAAVMLVTSLNKEKVSITAEEFNTIMTSNGYKMTDATSQLADYGASVIKVYIAQKPGYQIEFYELATEEYAEQSFLGNKNNFEESKASASSNVGLNGKNYNTYMLSSAGKYKYISRINNTMIYINADGEYKQEIKDIMKILGY